MQLPPLPTRLWPQKPTPTQLKFLLAPERRVLYGGAAGGGKSSALLMVASQYVEYPDYRALVIRKTYNELIMPDAILDRARQWWLPLDIKYSTQRYLFTFPSGAQIQFGYLANKGDEHRYQGAAFSALIVDEVSQLQPEQVQYLGSRLRRSVDSDIPVRMRFGSNPGGPGHDWLYDDYVNAETRKPDNRFIPARLTDNPHLDFDDYVIQLGELDPVTKAQLLHGDWTALISTGWFEIHKIKLIRDAMPDIVDYVRAWDLASTEGDGDYTVGALMGRTRAGGYCVVDIQRGQWSPSQVEERVRATAESDPVRTRIVMEEEGGASGKIVIDHYARNILPGRIFTGVRATGNKTDRAQPLAAGIANGLLSAMRAPWTQPMLNELSQFPDPDDELHDDQVDALALAYNQLARPHRAEKPRVFGQKRWRQP